MKVTFNNNLEGVDWIATYAKDEYQFEILREKLFFNYIYFNCYFLILDESGNETVQEKPLQGYSDN